MRQIFLLVSTFLVSATSFADVTATHNLGNALGSAWKSHQTGQPQSTRNDITIVYGGEDVSNRPTLALHSTTA